MQRNRNLLPQDLGFSPGTSLIGNFGATEKRFTKIPLDQAPEPLNPGPGAYDPPLSTLHLDGNRWDAERRDRKGWGTALGHVLDLAAGDTPGPGTYGEEEHPLGGIMTGLRRSWPGVNAMSGFGTNASLPTLQRPPMSKEPGPGQYNVDDASRFKSNTKSGFQSPFIGASRARTGSKLQRDTDSKLHASFASTRPAHKLPMPGDESGAAIDAPNQTRPGPDAYLPCDHTIAAQTTRTQRQVLRRHDGGVYGASFDRDARFGKLADRGEPDSDNPGPGTHTLARFDGHRPSNRRPRSDEAQAAFLTSEQRFHETRAGTDPDSLIAFLAAGPMGAVGRPVHAQHAASIVAKRAAAVKGR